VTDQPQDTEAVDEAAAVDRESVASDVPGRDGGPQDPDAMQAAEGLEAPKNVAESYDDMLQRGADHKGEGRVP
jgi:hypothetical protein